YSSGNSSNKEDNLMVSAPFIGSQSLVLQGILLTVHIINLYLSIVKHTKSSKGVGMIFYHNFQQYPTPICSFIKPKNFPRIKTNLSHFLILNGIPVYS
ncbi:MAG: hypothetical protein ACP5OE_05710, partial [Thermodesulfobium sp.]